MSLSGRRRMQAAEAAEILMSGSPQRSHSSMSTYRPSSGGPTSTYARPLTSIGERTVRPRTPGGGSVGLDTQLTVEGRPVTHHGMISMRTPSQGPGRKILDKSYFLGKLRSKKQELQAEIDTMTTEIDRLLKRGPASVHLEHHQEYLVEEVKNLRVQLGDYNMVLEKVAAGMELEQLKENLRSMKEKIDRERREIDQLFSERSQLSKKLDEMKQLDKEGEIEEFEKNTRLLEGELERQLDHAADKRDKYLELKREHQLLTDEVEELETKLENLNHSIEPLEQDLAKTSPTKQKAVKLVEQSLIAENELQRLKSEITPVAQLSPAEAREAMLSQIRQDNAEIARAEEKSKLLETEIKTLEDKLLAAEKVLNELKGGRADKFLEMQEKDKKMQSFIDDYERIHRDRTEAVRLVKEKIDLLLENVDYILDTGDRTSNDGCSADVTQDIEGLTQDLEERKRELKQLEDMELKTRKEIASCREKIACSQAEIEKFTRLDDLRAASESKCSSLEEEKKVIEGKTLSVQVQSKEQTMKLELMQNQVNESPVHKSLETLHEKLLTIQRSISKAQEEIDARERELNYTPVLENIRFMVAQLNGEIKSRLIH